MKDYKGVKYNKIVDNVYKIKYPSGVSVTINADSEQEVLVIIDDMRSKLGLEP